MAYSGGMTLYLNQGMFFPESRMQSPSCGYVNKEIDDDPVDGRVSFHHFQVPNLKCLSENRLPGNPMELPSCFVRNDMKLPHFFFRVVPVLSSPVDGRCYDSSYWVAGWSRKLHSCCLTGFHVNTWPVQAQ